MTAAFAFLHHPKNSPVKQDPGNSWNWQKREERPPITDEIAHQGQDEPGRDPEELKAKSNDGCPLASADLQHPGEDALKVT